MVDIHFHCCLLHTGIPSVLPVHWVLDPLPSIHRRDIYPLHCSRPGRGKNEIGMASEIPEETKKAHHFTQEYLIN